MVIALKFRASDSSQVGLSLFLELIVGQTTERHCDHALRGSLDRRAVIALPAAGRKNDRAGAAALGHDRCDHQIVAEHELIFDRRETLVGPRPFERADDRFAGLGRLAREGENGGAELRVELGGRARTVVFPPGRWQGDDGSTVEGPTQREIEVPLSRLPYYQLQKK